MCHGVLLHQIAERVGVTALDVKNVIIWGNHSSTQFPDVTHASVTINGTTCNVMDAVKDDNWIKNDFITVSRKPLNYQILMQTDILICYKHAGNIIYITN